MESHSDVSTYEKYYKEIQNKLASLTNETDRNKQAQIIKELEDLDKRFVSTVLSDPNSTIKKVYFTRHATCGRTEKKYGLAPNAMVAESALLAMKDTSNITKAFLEDNQANSCIAISPMIRAKQTAGMLIPNNFAGKIQVVDFLTENSSAPSGKPLLDKDDLQKSGTNIASRLSNIIYNENDSYFGDLEEKSKKANQLILSKPINKDSFSVSIEGGNLADVDKIERINSYTKNHEGDIWFIGHGKNTKSYFGKRYIIDTDLKYCETRKVLHYQHHNQPEEFVAPYILTVNQNTGLLQGEMLIPQQRLITYSNPIDELKKYRNDRTEEHRISAEKADAGGLLTQGLKIFTTFSKELSSIDYVTKNNAVTKLINVLENKNIGTPLTVAERMALNDGRINQIANKYDIDIDKLFRVEHTAKPQGL